MKNRIHTSLRSTLAPAALALATLHLMSPGALAAQSQQVAASTRDLQLELREVVESRMTSLGGKPIVTLRGPAGATYDLFGGFSLMGAFGFDTAVAVPGVVGPISAPTGSSLLHLFTPRGGLVPGVIPASGVVELDLAFPVPTGLIPLHLELQAIAQLGNGPILASNGAIRQVIAQPPATTEWIMADSFAGADSYRWRDIEQGDVDGDGDNDTVAAGQQGTYLWRTVNGSHASSSQRLVLQVSSTCKLADLDNDGDLDLAVGNQSAHFLRIFINGGVNAAGAWNGFSELGFQKIGLTGVPGSTIEHIEIGDVDGDGFRDLFLACSGSGQQNRLFINLLRRSNTTMFKDMTASSLPAILDDTDDAEMFDYDLDGDLDIVVANFDGASSVAGNGVDYLLVNQGGAQGGIRGTFVRPVPNPIPAADDETLDVAVGDVNGDGLPDLYFANWCITGGPLAQVPRADRLLHQTVVNGVRAFVDQSALLPASALGFSTDAEILDVNFDGRMDIVVALGALSGLSNTYVPQLTGLSTGMNVLLGNGTGFSHIPTNPDIAQLDFCDIECGDWARGSANPGSASPADFAPFAELDFGCALTIPTGVPGSPGGPWQPYGATVRTLNHVP